MKMPDLDSLRELLATAIYSFKYDGKLNTLIKILRYPFKKRYTNSSTVPIFEFIARNNTENKKVAIIGPTMDWNFSMFQRPQQLALSLVKNGYFVIYLSQKNSNKDYYCIRDNLYVLERTSFKGLMTSLYNILIIYPQGVYWSTRKEELINLAKMNIFFYDYLDAIDDKIAGKKNARKLIDMHNFFVEHQEHFIFSCTSKLLYDQAVDSGVNKVLLVQNGVDTDIFKPQTCIPDDDRFKQILKKKRPIIGYFGALSPWLDYDLLNTVAKKQPEWEFCYIGIDYNHGIKNLDLSLPNVTWLGKKNHTDLPSYASHFNIGIIPFITGAIAKATSPIKLFEYLALELQVLITPDLEECKGYSGVSIVDSPESFIENVNKILSDTNTQLLKNEMRRCAMNNSWDVRIKVIINYVNTNYPSYSLLHKAQRELAEKGNELGLSDYYKEYSKYEIGYWHPVVQWIYNLERLESVLDVGAAYGTLLIYISKLFPHCKKVMLDKNLASSERLRNYYNIITENGDIEKYDFFNIGSFDCIIMTEVIEHFNYHPAKTLLKLKSLLNKNGIFIITTPDAASWGRVTRYYSRLEKIPEYSGQKDPWIDAHVWQYSKEELESLFRDCGFRIVKFAYSIGVQNKQHLCFMLQKE